MQAEKRTVRIVAVSDTHDKHKFIEPEHLPPADIFIHAGDFTKMSRIKEFKKFREFISSLPYKHKIVIPGNHDFGLEQDHQRYKAISQKFGVRDKEMVVPSEELKMLKEVCTVLMHQEIEVEGLKIFGSQYVISDIMMGFTYPPGEGEKVWANLPKKVDILVTHCPPFGIHDVSIHNNSSTGCKALLDAVEKMQPKVHIFGHIHQAHGNSKIGQTHFYNVGFLDEHYQPKNKPVLIQLSVDSLKQNK